MAGLYAFTISRHAEICAVFVGLLRQLVRGGKFGCQCWAILQAIPNFLRVTAMPAEENEKRHPQNEVAKKRVMLQVQIITE